MLKKFEIEKKVKKFREALQKSNYFPITDVNIQHWIDLMQLME
jgi:hypothetical protein